MKHASIRNWVVMNASMMIKKLKIIITYKGPDHSYKTETKV